MTGGNLWKSLDLQSWHKNLAAYETAVQLLSIKKKKPKLVTLDKWYQSTLGLTVCQRTPPNLEKHELVKLMEWKLTRGKFRPQLPSLIDSNSSEKVKSVSEISFRNIEDTKVALKDLCDLRGVGPATASAVLTALCPEKYCFMADESVAAVLPGKINYTAKYYLEYLECVREKSEELTQKDCGHVWSPHDVECALWSCTVNSICGGSEDVSGKSSGKVTVKRGTKRKVDNIEEKEKENAPCSTRRSNRKKLKS